MEDNTDFEEENLEALGREENLKRKRVSPCRHKLQGQAYPRYRNKKMTQQQPQPSSEQEELDLNYEWLQLIQMENFIENQKRELVENGAQNLHDEDKAWNKHQETERDSIEGEEDTLDDEDLAYIATIILNVFSKPKLIDPVSPEGAPVRAPTRATMPPKFNQQFNQNSTSHGSENENFSYFSNFEEEGHTDLADYFSDEEDDSWDNESFSSEGDTWSQPDFDDSENFKNQEHKPSKFNTALFGLETINETDFEDQGETNNLNGISCLSEETQLAFSAWQPFIPHEHAFRNFAAQSWPSYCSLQASSSQEPTLTQISTITTTTKLTPAPRKPTSPQREMPLSQPKDWPSFKPATRPFRRSWTKHWPESTKTCNRTRNLQTEFPDHPEPLRRYRRWKQRLQCSNRTNQNQNTRLQNTPQVTDAGSEPQVCIRWKSRNYSTMKPKTSTAKITSWETKWRKSSGRTTTCQTKLEKNTKHHQRSSRKTQLWLWSLGQSPPICSLNTTATEKLIPKRMISPRGENHFSKRRSESKSYSQHKRLNSNSESESRKENNQYDKQKLKSENRTENRDVKDMKVRNEEKPTKTKATMTAKVNEVKAIERTMTGFRKEIEKQLDTRIRSESTITLPPHFATTFYIPSLIYIHIIFTIFIFKNFISIFNPVVSDTVDHHFQPFTIGDLSNCKLLCLSRQTASVQAKTSVKHLQTLTPYDFSKLLKAWPDSRFRNLHWNPQFQTTYSQVKSGTLKTIFTMNHLFSTT